MIQLVPDSLPTNVINPKQYFFEGNAVGETIENLYSMDAHSFLSSYMATPSTRDAIIGFIDGAVMEHSEAPSQWKKSKETGCGCEKRIEVTHKHDDALNEKMADIEVLSFNEDAKLYMADGKYVKAICGGESVVENKDEAICFDLNNKKNETIAQMNGFDEVSSKKDGVVEILLNWSNPDLNYDLVVAWDAGEVDVKDICKPEEHFHIKSEMQIYPGTYRVSIVYKEGLPEDMNDTGIFPLTVDLNIFTPGASDKLHFTIKNRADISLGHVANIKVYRLNGDDDNNDDNRTDNDSPNSPDSLSPAMIFAPAIAPDCPPVEYTPSPTSPRPVYNYGGGFGTGGYFTLHGWGGGWGGWYGGGGGGGSSGSGSSIIDHHNCGGDTDCLPTLSNNNYGNDDNAKGPLRPLPPLAGGEPIRDLDEEDNCTGNESCGCIPCEYEIVPYLKQVYLGPLRDANFSIYALHAYASKQALYSGKTSNGNTLYDAGEMDVPIAVLQSLADDELYIIEVEGGEDIDSNDDFIVDTVPTKNQGKVYALATGKDIKFTGLKVNILTTVTFELVKEMILAEKSKADITLKMTDIASRLLRYKVYPKQDEAISNIDLLAWLPTVDKDLLQRSYDPLESIVQNIYAGNDFYEDAYEYVYFKSSSESDSNATVIDNATPPIIRGFVSEISEDAQGGTVVGRIEILRGSDEIRFGSLRGKGSEAFEIDASGIIRLKEDAALDYETKWLYKLSAEAFNASGGSGEVGVYVSVLNVVDAPEYVSFDGGSIAENALPGTVAGTLNFNDGAGEITSFELQGESVDLFEIDTQGVIRLKEGAALDYEQTYSYGFVVLAHNSFGVSLPVMLYINVTDIADEPYLKDYKGGYVHESAPAGTVVGTVVFDKGGSDITSITLDGIGAENFTINTEGVIRVAEGALLDYETFKVYQPTVTLTNSFGSSKATRIFIEISDTKDAPSFVSFSGGNVQENSKAGTVVGQIVFDAGAAAIETITLSGDGSDMFNILDNGMIVVAKNGLDYEEKNHYILKAVASNIFGPSLEVTLNLFVDDVSETPVVLSDFVKNNFPENSDIGTVIGQIEILNQGSSAIELFELSGAGNDVFSVDVLGTITLVKPLNFELQEVYNLHVKAKNSTGFSNSVNVIVRVLDVDDPVLDVNNSIIISGFSSTIHDDISSNSIIGYVLVQETGGHTLDHFLLSGEESEKFIIDASGVVRVSQHVDFNNKLKNHYELTVVAVSSTGEKSNEASLNIFITESLPERPLLEPFVATVPENSDIGTVVGRINVLSNGSSPIEKFEILGNISDYFSIDRAGVITTTHKFDFESQNTYSFNVVAKNQQIQSNPTLIAINIGNIPDTAPVIEGFSQSLEENVAENTLVGKIKVLYLDETNITSFDLNGSGSSSFAIDENGTIRVAPNVTLDYESKKSYTLHVVANNSIGSSNEALVSIRILDIGYSPIIEGFSNDVKVNSDVGSVVGVVTVRDDGDSPVQTFELIKSSDYFSIDNSGIVRLEKSLLEQEAIAFTLQAHAQNAFGQSEAVEIQINLSVEEPIISDVNISIAENTAVESVIGSIPVKLAEDANITSFKVSGTGAELFNILPNGNIVLKGNVNYEVTTHYALSVVATNAHGNSEPATLEITVNNVMDADFLANTTLSVDEHAAPGTVIGTINTIENQDCTVISYENPKYDPWFDEFGKFDITADGTVKVGQNTVLDYENRSWHEFNIRALTSCGLSNIVRLKIDINDLDESAEVGIGVLDGAKINIYRIENNETLTELFGGVTPEFSRVSRSDNRALFNSHKYELDPNMFYIFEAVGGKDLDIDNDGELESSSNSVGFSGKLRAIVKGSWLLEIDRLRVTPVTELIYGHL